jgi:hypothetical protein
MINTRMGYFQSVVIKPSPVADRQHYFTVNQPKVARVNDGDKIARLTASGSGDQTGNWVPVHLHLVVEISHVDLTRLYP